MQYKQPLQVPVNIVFSLSFITGEVNTGLSNLNFQLTDPSDSSIENRLPPNVVTKTVDSVQLGAEKMLLKSKTTFHKIFFFLK